MGFSAAERERRHGAMRRIMEADGLKALLLLGDTNVGSDIYGDFRYLTENLNIIHPTVLTPDGKNSFFWGETYLVTDGGHERINRASDELKTV